MDSAENISFPKIVILLPTRQDASTVRENQALCHLYVFKMTGILNREQEPSYRIEYILVFTSHKTDTFEWVLIQ